MCFVHCVLELCWADEVGNGGLVPLSPVSTRCWDAGPTQRCVSFFRLPDLLLWVYHIGLSWSLLCAEYSGKSRWNTWPSSLYGKKIPDWDFPTDPGNFCGSEGRSGHFPISGAMAGTEGRSDILEWNDIICSKHGSSYSPSPSWGGGMGERVRRRAQVLRTVFPKWLSAAILWWKQKVYHTPHPLYNGQTAEHGGWQALC